MMIKSMYVFLQNARILIAAFILLISGNVSAQTKIIIFGGGPDPDSSELSIEKNVAWVSSILKDNGINAMDIQFASGSNGQSDVKENDPTKGGYDRWLPLARVLSSKSALLATYRKNTVANLTQENTRENVIQLINKRLEESQSDDNLLVIYLGHGGRASDNTNNNYLRLWGESKLSVIDLVDLLQKQPDDVTFRFVFPQCFSGSFVKLIHTDPNHLTLDNISTKRCGFVTVPDDRQSEGCTLENDETKYRDFSTYFFAAINGKNRFGQLLAWNPDKNNDGIVNIREAYFYANIEAYARDVPRATSEYYLELWEPWYVRWTPFDIASVDNEYKDVAAHIALKLGIQKSPDDPDFMGAVYKSRQQAVIAKNEVEHRLAELKKAEKRTREQLKKEINLRWPQASNKYIDTYAVFVEQELDRITQWLISQPAFNDLVKLQDDIEKSGVEYLLAERNEGMNMRLQRAIHLAKLDSAINRFGTENVLEKYQELVNCESWDAFQE